MKHGAQRTNHRPDPHTHHQGLPGGHDRLGLEGVLNRHEAHHADGHGGEDADVHVDEVGGDQHQAGADREGPVVAVGVHPEGQRHQRSAVGQGDVGEVHHHVTAVLPLPAEQNQ